MVEAPVAAAAFGPYRLEALLSSSATARIYRAADDRHGGRAVAVKLFAPHLSGDPAFVERFRRDAELLSALREPHVVPIHTYGVHEGVAFLDMRLVDGRSLADVRRVGALGADRADRIADQLIAASGAVRTSGLGDRAIAGEDVLLSGPPGRDFVHVVGLGVGRPPTGAPIDVVALVGVPAPARPRRRWWAVAAVAAVLALVAAVAVSLGTGREVLAPGQVAALRSGAAAVAAVTTVLNGRPVVVTAGGGAIRTWDLVTGRSAAPAISVDAGAVAATVVRGSPVVVSRGADQRIRVHRVTDGRELHDPIGVAAPLAGPGSFESIPWDLGTAEVDGRPVVVGAQRTGPISDPAVGFAVWTLPSGASLVDFVSPRPAVALDLETATIDGTAAVVTLPAPEGTIRTFDAASGEPIGSPIAAGVPVEAIDVIDRRPGPVVVAGCTDNTVRLFDLRTGSPVGPVLRGHTGRVVRVTAVRSGDRDLLVSTSVAGSPAVAETRFWDLDAGTAVGPVLVGNPFGAVLAAVDVDGRALLVTSTPDGGAVWDVAALVEAGPP